MFDVFVTPKKYPSGVLEVTELFLPWSFVLRGSWWSLNKKPLWMAQKQLPQRWPDNKQAEIIFHHGSIQPHFSFKQCHPADLIVFAGRAAVLMDKRWNYKLERSSERRWLWERTIKTLSCWPSSIGTTKDRWINVVGGSTAFCRSKIIIIFPDCTGSVNDVPCKPTISCQ